MRLLVKKFICCYSHFLSQISIFIDDFYWRFLLTIFIDDFYLKPPFPIRVVRDTIYIYDAAVMTLILLKYFSDKQNQDRNGMLFAWLGTVFNTSKEYLRIIFEMYGTVLASSDYANATVQY